MNWLKRWKEPMKTAVILLLAASALLLAWQTRLFSELFRRQGSAAEGPAQYGENLTIQAAAWPQAAMVTSEAGLRYGVAYDGAALDALYKDFSALLGEALGSAETPVMVSDKTWRKALEEPSLFLDYGCAPALQVLAAWLGTEVSWGGDYDARCLMLSGGGEGNTALYFMNDAGTAWRTETMTSWQALQSRMESYLPNGAAFAYSYRSLQGCAPYAVILAELPATAALHVTGKQSETAAVAAGLFGVSLGGGNNYPEADGTQVYLGDNGNLRLEPGGGVRYTAADGEGLSAGLTPADQVETSRSLLEKLHSAYSGAEKLRYAATVRYEQGSLIRFDYEIEGIPLRMADGCAAWVACQDGMITELWLLPRAYQTSGGVEHLLPNLQAAAAAGACRKGGRAVLAYHDSGGSDGTLTPFWAAED